MDEEHKRWPITASMSLVQRANWLIELIEGAFDQEVIFFGTTGNGLCLWFDVE
jgi:hypothetical protein